MNQPQDTQTNTNTSRAQAYTIEALIGVILITVAVLFISSSFAAPISNEEIDREINTTQQVHELNGILDYYQHTGALKSSLLHYNTTKNGWHYRGVNNPSEANPSERDEYPGVDFWTTVSSLTGNNELTRFAQQLNDFEEKYDVSISIDIRATNATGYTKQIPMIAQPGKAGDFMETHATITKSIVLYGTDIPGKVGRNVADKYTQDGKTLPATRNAETDQTLYDIKDDGSENYFIGPFDSSTTQQGIYNTVRMTFMIKSN